MYAEPAYFVFPPHRRICEPSKSRTEFIPIVERTRAANTLRRASECQAASVLSTFSRAVTTVLGYYTGLTSDVSARLMSHNEGRCRHTISGRPWHLDVVVEFADEQRAIAFERYLKSGSGNAFAKRHLR